MLMLLLRLRCDRGQMIFLLCHNPDAWENQTRVNVGKIPPGPHSGEARPGRPSYARRAVVAGSSTSIVFGFTATP